jgi:probable HAF family extracellular repeat protein
LALAVLKSTVYAASYTLTKIDNLGEPTFGSAINDLGQVAGTKYFLDGTRHAFIWSQQDGMVDLGTLPGDQNSDARAINNSGQVTGTSFSGNGTSTQHGYMWQAGSGFVDMSASTGLSVTPLAINNQGQVVGTASANLSSSLGFIYDTKNGLTPVSIAGTLTYEVHAINNVGQMIVDSPQSDYPLFFSPGQEPTQIQGIGYTNAVLSMNDAGSVVGYAITSASYLAHAFVWNQEMGMIDLTPNPDGSASANSINKPAKSSAMNCSRMVLQWVFFTTTAPSTISPPSSIPPPMAGATSSSKASTTTAKSPA